MDAPPAVYWEFDWQRRPRLTPEERDDPMRGMWLPSMFRTDEAMQHRLTWARPIENWDEATIADSDHPLPLEEHPREIEDVPYSFEAPIVSQRTRELLERVAPGCVQFLPVTMTQFRGQPIRIGRYWVANIVRIVDCLDPEPGGVSPIPERIGRFMPADKVQVHAARSRILRGSIPPDAALFRMKTQYITIVASDDVRRAFEVAGITGVRFLPLPFRVV